MTLSSPILKPSVLLTITTSCQCVIQINCAMNEVPPHFLHSESTAEQFYGVACGGHLLVWGERAKPPHHFAPSSANKRSMPVKQFNSTFTYFSFYTPPFSSAFKFPQSRQVFPFLGHRQPLSSSPSGRAAFSAPKGHVPKPFQ